MQTKIGFCLQKLDPQIFPVNLNTGEFANAIRDSVCASVLSVFNGEARVLLIALDVRGLSKPFIDTVTAKLAESTGVPHTNIVFHCSHNHSAPNLGASEIPSVADWENNVALSGILKAAVTAITDEKEVTQITGGRKQTQYLNFVRRYLLENGEWSGIATGKPPVPRIAHESEADGEVRGVRISRKDGKDIILVNFQTHAASACGQAKGFVSADFVGALRERLAQHTGADVMYWQGYCGNTNYNTMLDSEKPFKKEHFWEVGEALADAVAQALQEKPEVLTLGEAKFVASFVPCSLNHTKAHLYEKVKEIDAYVDAHGNDPVETEQLFQEIGLQNTFEGYALYFRAGRPAVENLPVYALTIGDFALVTCPFEMFDLLGMQLRAASPYAMTFSCGYTGELKGYMPSYDMFPHGVYETYVCDFLPGTGEKVVLHSLALLEKLKKEC